MEWFLEGNRRFRDRIFRKQPNLLPSLADGQQPAALWIGCSDSRVPASTVVDAPPGRLFVHRNIGNIVAPDDPNLAAVVEYAVDHLHVPEVILCGHTGCGAMTALCESAAKSSPADAISRWLHHAVPARDRVDAERIDRSPDERLREVIKANVLLQMEHLREFSPVARALVGGRLRIQGMLYHLETGELERLGAMMILD